MKTSVLPHQIITSRSQPCFALNARMSAIELLGQVPLVLALLDVRAVEPLHVPLIEHRRHRLDRLELGRTCSSSDGSSTPAVRAAA